MSIRTILVAFLALVCGGSAVVGITMLRGQTLEPTKADTVFIVVAAAEIPRGRPISTDLLTTKEYPKDFVPEGAILTKEEVLDRIVAIPLVKDDPILEAKLASKNSRGPASLIPDGLRGFTITTTISTAVAGLLLPGNRVDVLLTMSNGQTTDPNGGGATTTLLQNVEIFAIEHHIEAPTETTKADPNVRTVTLLVTPDQAPMLELGQTKGTLHLTLRGSNDNKATNPKVATVKGIQGHQDKPWDERLKGVLEAVAKSAPPEKAPEKPVETKVEPTLPVETPTTTIRTIKGTTEGDVVVERADARAKRP